MERKLLQVAFAVAELVLVGFGLAGVVLIGLAGELIFAPLLWLRQGHVARGARRCAVT